MSYSLSLSPPVANVEGADIRNAVVEAFETSSAENQRANGTYDEARSAIETLAATAQLIADKIAARGSTRKGGAAGLQVVIDRVRAGHAAALTIDGPKGPPRQAQRGVLEVVRQTGAVLLPVAGASSRPWFANSWDRYLVPTPFSRCVAVFGEPLSIPPNMPDREALAMIAAGVDAATLEADRAVGVVPPPPWAS